MSRDLTPQRMKEIIQQNAGKAFELMLNKVEKERADRWGSKTSRRKAAIEYAEDFDIIQVVNTERASSA